MDYLVIIEKTDTGYSAYVPDLPGCITVGDTKEEVQAHIKEAIQLHIEGMREDGWRYLRLALKPLQWRHESKANCHATKARWLVSGESARQPSAV